MLRAGPGAGSWPRAAPTRDASGSSPLWWSRLLVPGLGAGLGAGSIPRGAMGAEQPWEDVLSPIRGAGSGCCSRCWVLAAGSIQPGCIGFGSGRFRRSGMLARALRCGAREGVLAPAAVCGSGSSPRVLPGQDVLAPGRMLALAGLSGLMELLPSSRVPWDLGGRAGASGWEVWLRVAPVPTSASVHGPSAAV